MKAVFTLFSTSDQAQDALADLIGQGFSQDGMNVIVQDSVVRTRTNQRRDTIDIWNSASGNAPRENSWLD